jgi:hypothetical protein
MSPPNLPGNRHRPPIHAFASDQIDLIKHFEINNLPEFFRFGCQGKFEAKLGCGFFVTYIKTHGYVFVTIQFKLIGVGVQLICKKDG